jgi:hypothetical protein
MAHDDQRVTFGHDIFGHARAHQADTDKSNHGFTHEDTPLKNQVM